MNKKTRQITLSAMFSALSAVSLYFASVWPTGQVGIVAFSSLFVAAAVIEMGIVQGIYVFIVSSLLGILLLPDKAAPLLYILFFGFYPVIKSSSEMVRSRMLQWVIKLAVFNAALTVIWFFVRWIFIDFGENSPGTAIIYLFGNVIFIVFDYGYTKLIWFYLNRISKYIKKGIRDK